MTQNAEKRRPTKGTPLNRRTVEAPAKPLTDASILPDPWHLLEGVHVVIVAIDHTDDVRFRRRIYFNLPSAERAAARAVERGHRAAVMLCRLAPVEIPGRWSA